MHETKYMSKICLVKFEFDLLLVITSCIKQETHVTLNNTFYEALGTCSQKVSIGVIAKSKD
jgi:hypothetical protein